MCDQISDQISDQKVVVLRRCGKQGYKPFEKNKKMIIMTTVIIVVTVGLCGLCNWVAASLRALQVFTSGFLHSSTEKETLKGGVRCWLIREAVGGYRSPVAISVHIVCHVLFGGNVPVRRLLIGQPEGIFQ
jgi:hypothetical protein